MRRSMLLGPVLLLLAGAAHAQGERPRDPYDPPIVPEGNDMRPMGTVLGVYDKEEIGEPDKPQDRCGKQVGCIVFMNVTRSFDVVGIYVDTHAQDDPRGPRWDTNLLKGSSLGPRRSMFTFRNGDRTMCNQRVRVVMRHRKSRTELEGVPGNVNLCNDRTNQNIVFPVRVIEGRVIFDPDEAGE